MQHQLLRQQLVTLQSQLADQPSEHQQQRLRDLEAKLLEQEAQIQVQRQFTRFVYRLWQ